MKKKRLTKIWLVDIFVHLEIREDIVQIELFELVEEKLKAELVHFWGAPLYFINL